ncbi:MAG: O-antigen ligase family protein, partial [Alphaproteobacteria bacterium]
GFLPARIVVVAILFLSPFAFGGVHLVTKTGLVVAIGALGVVCILRAVLSSRGSRWTEVFSERAARVAIGCVAVAVAIAVIQCVPLPRSVLSVLSPKVLAARVQLEQSAILFPRGDSEWMPLSIQPGRSVFSACLVAAYAMMFWIVLFNFRRRRENFLLAGGIAGACLALSILGIWQFLSPGGARYIHLFWRPRYMSYPFGPFVNRNHFAGYQAMGIPVALAVMACAWRWARRSHRAMAAVRYGAALACTVAVAVMVLAQIMCASRGGWIALSAGIIFLLGLEAARARGRLRRLGSGAGWLVMILVLALLINGFLFLDPGIRSMIGEKLQRVSLAAADRVRVWRHFSRVARDFPILGVGIGAFRDISPSYTPPGARVVFHHPENELIEIASEMGLFSLAAIIVFVGAVFWQVFKQAFTASEGPERSRYSTLLLSGCAAGFFAFAVHSLVDFNLRIPSNGLLAISLAAAALSMASPPIGSRERMPSILRPAAAAIGVAVCLGACLVAARTWRANQLARRPEIASREKAARLLPWDAPIRHALGRRCESEARRLIADGHPEKANPLTAQTKAELAQACWLAPFRAGFRYSLATFLVDLSDDADARAEGVAQMRAAIALDPNTEEYRMSLVLAAMDAHDDNEAIAQARELYAHFPDALRRLAANLLAEGTDTTLLRQVVPLHPQAREELGRLFEKNGKTLLARDEYLLACQLSGDKDFELRCRLAERVYQTGAHDQALKLLREWAASQPVRPAYYWRLAELLDRDGQTAEAIAIAEKLASDPATNNPIQNRRVLAGFYEHNGDTAKAEQYLREAIALTPRDPVGYWQLADFFQRIQKPDQAAQSLQQAAAVQPNDHRCFVKLGDFLRDRREYASALKAYRRAARLEPGKEWIQHRITQLRQEWEALRAGFRSQD